MNLFQWIVVPILALLFLREASRMYRGFARRGPALLRALIWAGGALAVAYPNLVQQAATGVGIGTGANLVSYVVALAFVGTSFYFYSRSVRQQQQITELVRHLAIRGAMQAGGESAAGLRGGIAAS